MNFFFIYLASMIFVQAISYSTVLPFFAEIALNKGISVQYIGIIISSYCFGGLFINTLCSDIFKIISKRNLLIASKIILFFCTFTTSFIQEMNNILIFSSVNIMIRFFIGISYAISFGCVSSIIQDIYINKLQKISYIEVILCLGLSGGFLIGGVFYSIIGFKNTFLLISALIIVLFLITIFYLNEETIEKNREVKEINTSLKKEDLSWSLVLRSPRILSLYLQFICVSTSLLIYVPGFSLYLKNQYGLNERESSYIYSFRLLTNMIFSLIFSKINWKISLQAQIVLSNFFSGLSICFLGPSNFIFLVPKKLIVSIFSMFFLSIFSVFSIVPFMSEIFDLIKKINTKFSSFQCNIMTSLIFSSAWNLAELFAPIFYGYLTKYFGYEDGIFFYGCFMMVVALIHIIFLGFNKEKDLKKKVDIEMDLLNK